MINLMSKKERCNLEKEVKKIVDKQDSGFKDFVYETLTNKANLDASNIENDFIEKWQDKIDKAGKGWLTKDGSYPENNKTDIFTEGKVGIGKKSEDYNLEVSGCKKSLFKMPMAELGIRRNSLIFYFLEPNKVTYQQPFSMDTIDNMQIDGKVLTPNSVDNKNGFNVPQYKFVDSKGEEYITSTLNTEDSGHSYIFVKDRGIHNQMPYSIDDEVQLYYVEEASSGSEPCKVVNVADTLKVHVNSKGELPTENNPSNILSVDDEGVIHKSSVDNLSDKDWLKEEDDSIPNDIEDNIYTKGNVGIGKKPGEYKLNVAKCTTDAMVFQGTNNLEFDENFVGVISSNVSMKSDVFSIDGEELSPNYNGKYKIYINNPEQNYVIVDNFSQSDKSGFVVDWDSSNIDVNNFALLTRYQGFKLVFTKDGQPSLGYCGVANFGDLLKVVVDSTGEIPLEQNPAIALVLDNQGNVKRAMFPYIDSLQEKITELERRVEELESK